MTALLRPLPGLGQLDRILTLDDVFGQRDLADSLADDVEREIFQRLKPDAPFAHVELFAAREELLPEPRFKAVE